MRVSTNMIYDQGVIALQKQSAALLYTGQQIATGRLNPAAVDWAKGLPVASLKAFLQVATPVAALTGMQSQGKDPGKPATGTAALTDGELAVCRAMGISPDDFAKNKGA